MKQIVIVALGLLTLIGCIGGRNTNDSIEQKTGMGQSIEKSVVVFNNDSIEQKTGMGQSIEKSVVVFNNDSISFFGEKVLMDDSAHIMYQIGIVVEGEKKLSIKDEVLSVGDVGFGINLHKDGIVLISSIQVDDPKIKTVVKYLNTLYGTAREEEPDNYWWHNGEAYGNTIRLRPLASEEGGTVLLFY